MHPSFVDQPARTPAELRIDRRWWIGAALLVLLAGVVGTLLVLRAAPGANSAEVRFARDMAAHHEQAVQMALIIRDRSTNEELRTFALDILLTQQAQRGQMQGWLAAWNQPLAGVEPPMGGMGEMMGMATPQQVEELRSLPVAEADVRFLQLMTRHHQGGVMMAQAALDETNRAEVQRLASAITNSQQSEMEYMQTLLQQRGAEPLPALQPMQQMNHEP